MKRIFSIVNCDSDIYSIESALNNPGVNQTQADHIALGRPSA